MNFSTAPWAACGKDDQDSGCWPSERVTAERAIFVEALATHTVALAAGGVEAVVELAGSDDAL